MTLIRELDSSTNQEWLVVEDASRQGEEIMRFEWNDDLMIWMDAHQKEIDAGGINVFLEYRHQRNLT